MTEFELIAKYFSRPNRSALLGNGDDCAVIAPRPGYAFAVTTDTTIEGRHFLPTIDPQKLGQRVVAVNLSDLAAMGAAPSYAMLSIALPRVDERWLERFSTGLWRALDAHGVELIGGNTTRGALSIALTAFGEVPVANGKQGGLTRGGALPGDELWISGPLGDAGWALYCMLGDPRLSAAATATLEQIARYELPQARVALGLALREFATSCIDVSDGLMSEAMHIATASNVAIDIEFASIPTGLSDALSSLQDGAFARHCLLATGDAYELLFTAKASDQARVEALFREHDLHGARIGRVNAATEATSEESRVRVLDAQSHPMKIAANGWDHFAGSEV
jgi:thiamine-monophosphate kinase